MLTASPYDMTAAVRSTPVTPAQLRAHGLGTVANGDYVYRLRAELEADAETGTPAVGLYIDAREDARHRWECQTPGAFRGDPAEAVRLLESLLHEIDPYYPAWLSYHGVAENETGHGWLWLYTVARAREMGWRPGVKHGDLSAGELSRRCGGDPHANRITEYLTGKTGLGAKTWAKLARVLGIGVMVQMEEPR